MNDDTNSDAPRESDEPVTEVGAADQAHTEADRAAEGLRGQIAALRQQVKDAQETLRDHQRRRETRTFKR